MLPIVVVSGLPCTGKTTLATSLRDELNWPLLAKDAYKERLFESRETVTPEASQRSSAEAYALLFAEAPDLIKAKRSCILEGNFRRGVHDERFAALVEHGASFIQIHCHAPAELLVWRFRKRMSTRHVGHADQDRQAELEAELLTTRQEPLSIGGVVIDCASDDDRSPSFVAQAVQAALSVKPA